jgi:hypothetical protein
MKIETDIRMVKVRILVGKGKWGQASGFRFAMCNALLLFLRSQEKIFIATRSFDFLRFLFLFCPFAFDISS